MFSPIKSLIFRRTFIKICRYCTTCNPDMVVCFRSLSSNCCAIKYSQKRLLTYSPGTLVNSVASDADQENSTGFDEETGKKRPVQIKLIYELVKESKLLSEDELIKFRENVLSSGNVVNISNIDAIIMGICSSLKNMEFADGYMRFLKQTNSEINIATMGRYMKLCHSSDRLNDEIKVLNIWHSLREKLPLMDASTAENVIHGISVTSEWKQGFDLLSMVKETCTPSASAYSALIVAAFRNRDVELGWNLMEECIKEEKTPLDNVYLVWLNEYCTLRKQSNIDECVEMAEKLMKFFSCHEVSLSMEVIQKLKRTFERMKWKCRFTSINERGACKVCKRDMRPIFISKSEFQVLSQTFLEKVLVGPDVFSKSSPEEVEAFQELIAKNAPYNTVIDGLNVAYSGGTDSRNSRARPASLLKNVVAHFVDLSHKILVLGRTHMNTWPRWEMDYIRKNSQLFLAENLSQDDPFLLYAAMSSGPGTCFLSRDLMRGHAYRLKCAEPSLSGLFRRWQMSHQMRLLGVSDYNGVDIKLPMEFSPTVQKVDGVWHVPCQDEGSSSEEDDHTAESGKRPALTRSHLDPPTTWLCLSPKNNAGKDNNEKYGGNRDFYNEWNRNDSRY